ncbi:MAG: hypothetical protein MUC88_00285 [Planctomycetes bacterium]|jgi:hypothetical protein|nr:hypothetical protein [Planctomycetota bacterium]
MEELLRERMNKAMNKAISETCASLLVAREDRRVFIAAEKVERQCRETGDIVVDLPEYGNPTITPDHERSTPDTMAYRVNMQPTGRIVRYTIPRPVFAMWRAKWGQ